MPVDKIALAAFVIAVVAIGAFIGMNFEPGVWHENLVKPWFNPPGWIFGPVWTALYVLIGIAGWRVWFRSNDSMLRGMWVAQMVLNFAWSPAFFGAQSPALGLVVILPMLAVIYLFIARARRLEPISALLFLPYAAWVSFATLLTFAIFWLN